MLKRVRNRPGVNWIGRSVIRAAFRAVTKVIGRWPVSGEVRLKLADVELRCFGAADDHILNSLYYGRPWETGSLAAWAALLPKQGTVVDVGAYTGLYSLIAARAGPACTVVAVEPHPRNAARLLHNLSLNPGAEVEVAELALSDDEGREGTTQLTLPARGDISDVASLMRPFSEAHYDLEYGQQQVRCTTLDTLLGSRSSGPLRLLKIDVEGHELAVLRGARKTIERDRPAVICEIVDWEVFTVLRPLSIERFPSQEGEIEELAEELGYAIYLIGQRGALRVDSVRSSPDGIANYLLLPKASGPHFVPWTDVATLRSLAGDGHVPTLPADSVFTGPR